MNKNIAAALIAATVGTGVAHAGSSELMVGDKATAIDTKAHGSLTENLGYFVRNTTTMADGEASHFWVGDLTYDLGAGVALVGEAQAGATSHARAGVQYFGQHGPLTLYALGTTSSEVNPDVELVTLVKLAQGPLRLGMETVTGFDEGDRLYHTQNWRLGLANGDMEGGLALKVTEGSEPNVGAYFAKGF